MPETNELVRQIRRLNERIEKIESRLGGGDIEASHAKPGERCCSLPLVPEREFGPEVSEHRARLIRYIDRKWVNGTKLRYAFFRSGRWSGPESEMDLVRQGFEVWADVGIGIQFEEVTSIDDAEIRVGFLQDGRTWSYVGRDVIDIPGQNERTMNYGWRIEDDRRGVDVPVHEIGHTLGFPHEHQNPFAGIIWNEEAVYRHFARQGWSRADTDHNVLRKLSPADVEGSKWDPDSIMHYGFPAGLIVEPEAYRSGLTPALGLTENDREQVRQFYPMGNAERLKSLRPFQPEFLDIGPGEQLDFELAPNSTRDYTVQTFGRADTVMVLFEEAGNEFRFVAGDDDSGTSLNARIEARLRPDRRYVLRLRLYLNWASDQTTVMLW